MLSICAGSVNLTLMFTVLMHAVVFISLFRCVFVCVCVSGNGRGELGLSERVSAQLCLALLQ